MHTSKLVPARIAVVLPVEATIGEVIVDNPDAPVCTTQQEEELAGTEHIHLKIEQR